MQKESRTATIKMNTGSHSFWYNLKKSETGTKISTYLMVEKLDTIDGSVLSFLTKSTDFCFVAWS